MATLTTNTNDNLARLLATENIRIVYDSKAETASFDVRDRLLTMPVLKTEGPSHQAMNEMLLAHEVGHAVYTPADESTTKAACHRIDPKNLERAKLFLNIVEDARIEREMQAKFPGLRRTFISGYTALLKNTDLFDGMMEGRVEDMPLIDKINLHFKLGVNAGTEVPFTPEEQVFVDRVASCESFDDVVDVCEDIYTHMATTNINIRQKIKFKYDPNGEAMEGEGDDQDDEGDPMDGAGKSQEKIDSARKNQTVQMRGSAVSVDLPIYLPEVGNITTQEVMERFKKSSIWGQTDVIDAMIRYNKSAVTRMVADFERKKSASEFQKATLSRTGILDMTRIHQYRHDDELFLTSVDIRKGKSHGIVIVIDWSSSMSGRMFACLSQLTCLTSFCRAVKIPYEVYCFSSSVRYPDYDSRGIEKSCWKGSQEINGCVVIPNSCSIDPFFGMIRLTGSDISQKNENCILNMTLSYHFNESVASCMNVPSPSFRDDRYSSNGYSSYQAAFPSEVDGVLSLSGTPLDEAILACLEIVPAFKMKHILDMVNCIYLTDGDSTSHAYYTYDSRGVQQNPAMHTTYNYKGKSFLLSGHNRYDCTKMFRNIFRNVTGCNLINFFMRDSGNFTRWKSRMNESMAYDPAAAASTTIDDQFVEQRNHEGWDSQFTVCFDKKADGVGDVQAEMNSATTVVKIRNAFIRGMGKINTSRVLLNRVTDYITKHAGLVSAVRKQGVLDASRQDPVSSGPKG